MRLRECRAARQQRGLFESRAVAYEGLSADAALRLLLDSTQHLLGSEFADRSSVATAPPAAVPSMEGTPLRHSAAPMPPPGLLAPQATPPMSNPATTAPADPEPAGPVDVFIGSRRSPITQPWLREFVPLFTAWLSETLGRAARVSWDDGAAAAGDTTQSREFGSTAAGVFVPLLTATYAGSAWSQEEWSRFAASGVPIVPVWLQGDPSTFPPQFHDHAFQDFREFAFVGEGFSRNERYVEFQARIQQLVQVVAQRLLSTSSSDTPHASAVLDGERKRLVL